MILSSYNLFLVFLCFMRSVRL